MSTATAQDLEQGVLAFLRLVRTTPGKETLSFDHKRLENVLAEIEALRLESFATELREAYPGIDIDYDLLRLVGIDEDVSEAQEKELLTTIIGDLHGEPHIH